MKTALFAGSFDPITNGHLNIIERASKLFDSLTVAVVVNPNKNAVFNLEERLRLAEMACEGITNVGIDSFDGLLADYVNENQFNAVIRGLRDSSDFISERQMSYINETLYTEGTETVFVMTDPTCAFISSSMVKEVASLGGDVSGFVPECVKLALSEKY